MLKHFITILITTLLLILACIHVKAQQAYNISRSLDSVPGITIIQPQALADRLDKNVITVAETKQDRAVMPAKSGYYRVEVYADNSRTAKTQATAKRRNIQARFPQYPSVLQFEAPFWRVRVGEFRSRGDAESALTEIRQAFPAYGPYLRVVRN